MVGHHRLGRLAVRPYHLEGHWDVLGGSLGCAAGERQKGNAYRPGQVIEHGVLVAEVFIPELLVRSKRHGRLIFGNRPDPFESVIAPEAGFAPGANKAAQDTLLGTDWIERFDATHANPGVRLEASVDQRADRTGPGQPQDWRQSDRSRN